MRRFSQKEERRQKNQERKRPRKTSGGKPQERTSLFRRVLVFLKEVRVELERVSWPTREQMIAFTSVTVITSTFLTLLVFGMDLGLREGVFALLRLGR
ncbi:MAG: preprotein translocase subunit SecE [Acidimicrobiia bacterium]|nr:preprotein translocase subunit SecE [Acidimicrobiia bacterium]